MLPRNPPTSRLVVSLGASAGGLEALRGFFRAMPAPCGFAFVVVTHLDPDHESLLASILAQSTALTVETATDGVEIQDDHVYVLPPRYGVTIADRRLSLTPMPRARGIPIPIDRFFSSLAEDQQERAVCIVMSGAGAEGARGIQAVRSAGGLTMVQTPTSATVTGMPTSAIATGMVDYVVDVEAMPELLLRYAEHPYANGEPPADQGERDWLPRLLEIVRDQSGHDFTGYRGATIIRRIQRRLGLHHMPDVESYIARLEADPTEVAALAQDLLINVTGFFRDPEAWEALASRVVKPLVTRLKPAASLRVWVAGCATGEEAYGLAILFDEAFEAEGRACSVQIFATDRSEGAIQAARAGAYPASVAQNVSQKRLAAAFMRQPDGSFVIAKRIRDLVLFARHDALGDPPFSHIDLVSCRNLLIYLEQPVQQKLLALFHFVLEQDGFLFLGAAETVGSQSEYFAVVDAPLRIYRRIGRPRQRGPRQLGWGTDRKGRASASGLRPTPPRDMATARLAELALIHGFVPPAVVVREDFEVVYYHGDTHRFLVNPKGSPTRDLLAMVDERLRARLRASLRRVARDGQPVRVPPLGRDDAPAVQITVNAYSSHRSERLFVVAFEEGPPEVRDHAAILDDSPSVQLERELEAARADLDANVSELGLANEDLTTANEEVTSMNEELQSTNEELETSQEELRALNDELSSSNRELLTKVEQLKLASSDMANLLASTHIATLFLDPKLRLKRFTPAMTELLNLRTSDLGRPLADLAPKFTDPKLMEDARRVLADLTPREIEVRSDSARWYTRRVLPYRTVQGTVDGIVITFHDITSLKDSERDLRHSEERFRRVSEVGLVAVAFFDPEGRITEANDCFFDLMHRERAELAGEGLRWGQLVDSGSTESLERVLASALDDGAGEHIELAFRSPTGEVSWGIFAAALLADDPPEGVAFVVDVSARHVAESELRASAASLERRVAERTGYVQLLQDVAILANAAERLEAGLLAAMECFCRHFELGEGRIYLESDGYPHGEGAPTIVRYFHGERGRATDRRARPAEELGALATNVLESGVPQFGVGSSRGLGGDGEGALEAARGAVAFPILVGEAVVGVIELDWHAAEEPDEALRSVLAQSGTQLGRVVERHRARLKLRTMADELALSEERERRGLATLLHDDVGQLLAASRMRLPRLRDVLPDADSVWSLDEVSELMQQGIDACRAMTAQLSPSPLYDLGLEAAVEWVADEVRRRFGLEVTCVGDGLDKPLDEPARLVVYRAVSELLVNVAKHARVDTATVETRREGGSVVVTVSDEGVGFHPSELVREPGEGFGLFSIQEGVEHLGGSATIESAPGGGARITITVPLGDEAAEA